MNFLGLDLSSANTGWTLIEEMGEGRAPRITCGSFTCRGEDYDDNVRALSDHLYELLTGFRARGIRVDLAGVEEPLRALPKRKKVISDGMFASRTVEELASNPHTMLVLPAMSGGALVMLHRFKIRAVLVNVAKWRMLCIGRAYAPRGTPEKEKNGWAKREVRKWAADLGLRYGFIIKNSDQSDSVGIAVYAAIQHGDSMDVRKMLATRRVAA